MYGDVLKLLKDFPEDLKVRTEVWNDVSVDCIAIRGCADAPQGLPPGPEGNPSQAVKRRCGVIPHKRPPFCADNLLS